MTPISPAPPETALGVPTSTAFRLPRRYGSSERFRVSLRPTVDPWGDNEASGYLVMSGVGAANTESHSPAILRWTASAVEQLRPGGLLAFAMSPLAVAGEDFGQVAESLPTTNLVLVMANARVGQRRAQLDQALNAAKRLGIRVAVCGNRVSSTAGFDGLVVSPSTAAYDLKVSPGMIVVATDLQDTSDVEWARSLGATHLEGPAILDPLEMAPIEVPQSEPPPTVPDPSGWEAPTLAPVVF